MPVAGPVGLGSAALASELGTDSLKIIGVDVDQYILDTKNASVYLTTVEKGMDATVLGAIEAAKNGTFAGGVYVGTLANNGVRIAPYHDQASAVSNGLNNEIQKLKSSIINGFLSVKN
jgi:basic membrane protein A